jgi:hypothetical protein
MDGRVPRPEYEPNGQKVVNSLMGLAGSLALHAQADEINAGEVQFQAGLRNVENFVKRWREHFCDVLQPKHLPDKWTIEHRVVNR